MALAKQQAEAASSQATAAVRASDAAEAQVAIMRTQYETSTEESRRSRQAQGYFHLFALTTSAQEISGSSGAIAVALRDGRLSSASDSIDTLRRAYEDLFSAYFLFLPFASVTPFLSDAKQLADHASRGPRTINPLADSAQRDTASRQFQVHAEKLRVKASRLQESLRDWIIELSDETATG